MFTESDLLAQFASLDTANQQVIKLESPDETYAKTHCGIISGSNVYRLCTHQPNPEKASELKLEIEELTAKIQTSTSGKVATATKDREAKQKQLDRLLNDELPDGAVKFCEELAMLRITGYSEKSDIDFKSKATQWGIDNEPLAIEELKNRFDNHDFRFANEQQKFIRLDGFDYVGCTPDSVIYHNDAPFMTLDIKCPFNRAIHRHYKNVQSFAQFKRDYALYYWQFTLQMLCAGVNRHLFASFDPRHPKPKNKIFFHAFGLVQDDADFMLNRIKSAENLIAEIMKEFE